MSGAPGGHECDFCSVPSVAWAYPCRDFLVGDVGVPGVPDQGSNGAWAACPACHALIERGDRSRLAMRSAKRLAKKHGLSLKLVLRAVRQSQDAFWAHREGAAVPAERFTPDPTEGTVDPKHQLGPDYDAACAALREPVKAVLAMRTDGGEHVVYYLTGDDPYVRRAELLAADGQLVQVGEAQSLGAEWDAVRVAVTLGAA